MAIFVLVHGSFHGSWCWDRLAPLLVAEGHTVHTPNLPGSGSDTTPLDQVDLQAYVTKICQVVDARSDKVVLVGHSMGAIVCAQVAERRADALASVVFVCGLLLRSGETLMSFLAEFAHLGVADLVLENMVVRDGGKVSDFPIDKAPEIFYNRCAADDAQWASSQLTPQANAVYADTTTLSAEGFGRVRRFYVLGQDDRAVSPTYQRLMVERTPCERVFEIDTDHSPFLSTPALLADVLRTIVGAAC